MSQRMFDGLNVRYSFVQSCIIGSPMKTTYRIYSPIHVVYIDPRGRPVVITIFTQSVRPSVRPYVRKSKNFKFKRQSLPARDCGLAEWIIDDSCLVFIIFRGIEFHENWPPYKFRFYLLLSICILYEGYSKV